MNIILYYLNIILLLILIILITIYITKVNTNSYLTCQNLKDIENNNALNKQLNNVYDIKVSKEFEKMFNQNSLISNYESINSDLDNTSNKKN